MAAIVREALRARQKAGGLERGLCSSAKVRAFSGRRLAGRLSRWASLRVLFCIPLKHFLQLSSITFGIKAINIVFIKIKKYKHFKIIYNYISTQGHRGLERDREES